MAYRILKIEKCRNWRVSTQKASLIGKTPNGITGSNPVLSFFFAKITHPLMKTMNILREVKTMWINNNTYVNPTYAAYDLMTMFTSLIMIWF